MAAGDETVIRDKSGRPILAVDGVTGRVDQPWTPVIGGAGGTSGQTYTTQQGSFVRLGSLVFFTCKAVLSAKGTITGNVQIQGLPFPALAVSALDIFWATVLVNKVGLMAQIAIGNSAVDIYGLAAAGASPVALVTADIAATTEIDLTGCYIAAD
jgi:hypothetical protein